jgi:DnaK suppressor protein
MDERKRAQLRDDLVERRASLVEEGDLRADPNRPDPASQADEDEQPLNEMNQVIASRRNRMRAQEIASIDAALRRLEAEPDEYGRCVDCDEWIPVGRLTLMPWAQRCVECQSEHGDGPSDGRRRHALDFVDS